MVTVFRTPLALLLAVATVVATSVRAQEYEAKTYQDAAGNTLGYRWLKPQAIAPGKHYPLVLFLHGAGERGTDNQAQLIHGTHLFLKPEVREKFPCFVMAPQCPPEKKWVEMAWDGDAGTAPAEASVPLRLAMEAMAQLAKDNPIDDQRVYVTGLSMGGYGSWDCITRFPGKFAAAAPICGGGDEKTVTAEVAKTPVWAFHSEDDPVVRVVRTRNMVKAMREAGGKPHYFEYFGLGHNSWGQAYSEPELLPWMFAQRKGQPDTWTLKTPEPALPEVAKWPASDDLLPGKGPLQKADWFLNLWRQKRLAWWLSRTHEQGTVVFLGDSITQGWESLAKDFPNLRVANRGISGDVTRGVRYRLKEDVLDLHPAAVVMLIGTNDLGLGGNPEEAAENIRALLEAFAKYDAKLPVIVCKVMPRSGEYTQNVRRLNQLVDEAMQGRPQFIRCDTYGLFADDQGAAKKEEFPDLLHPNGPGYAKWQAALQPILAGLKLPKTAAR